MPALSGPLPSTTFMAALGLRHSTVLCRGILLFLAVGSIVGFSQYFEADHTVETQDFVQFEAALYLDGQCRVHSTEYCSRKWLTRRTSFCLPLSRSRMRSYPHERAHHLMERTGLTVMCMPTSDRLTRGLLLIAISEPPGSDVLGRL
jgi:hypothetical protein